MPTETPMRAGKPTRISLALGTVLGVTVGLAITWSNVDRRRADDYRDPLTIWQVTAEQQPDNALVQYCLGEVLMQAKRSGEAAGYFERALEIKPDYADPLNNLAAIWISQERYDEAIKLLEQGHKLKPESAEIVTNLGLALFKSGRKAEGIEHYRHAIRLRPNLVSAHYNYGSALLAEERYEEAREQFALAVKLRPGYAEALNNLGVTLIHLGRLPESIPYFERTLQEQPHDADARYNLVGAVERTMSPQGLVNHLTPWLQRIPDFLDAEQAVSIAYSRLNRPAQAIEGAERSVALARAKGDEELAQRIEAWLKDYRARHTGPQGAPAR